MKLLARQGYVRDLDVDFRTKSGEIRKARASAELVEIAGQHCIVSASSDITERLRMDEQFAQAEKMRAVGQLTSGIAHDFGNLLTVVKGNLSLLQQDFADGDDNEAAELLGDALSAAEDGVGLTRRLLGFSRSSVVSRTNIDVAEAVGGLLRLLKRSLPENVELENRVAYGSFRVRVDSSQLESALLNLVINARDAMPEGGRIRISATYDCLEGRSVQGYSDYEPGCYVAVVVSDTGTGMPEEVLRKACEPFFTTKEGHGGTGLGLSMVYGFVKQSGGGLLIESTPGSGTTVTMLLPEADPAEDQNWVEEDDRGFSARNETILVVEDNPTVRKLAVRILRGLGYRVIEAKNAKSARRILGQDEHVDLLFSDVVMPGGMNGCELAEWAVEFRPGLNVLLTTGSVDQLEALKAESDPVFPLLPKPYARDSLAREIRLALEPRSGSCAHVPSASS